MAKKIIYTDEWGEITQYQRKRDKRTGRLLKDKTRVVSRFIDTETIWYRSLHGKLLDKGKKKGKTVYKAVRRETPHETFKMTWPDLATDEQGLISEMLHQTNILTKVDLAKSALINLRGVLEDGSIWRRQFKIKKFGQFNQDQQLIMAIYKKLRENDLRTNYNIQQVQFTYRGKRAAMRRKILYDTQISVTLYR